jgi:hypothetical protein
MLIVLADQNVTTTGWWAIAIYGSGALVTFIAVARWAYRHADRDLGEAEYVGMSAIAALAWPLIAGALTLAGLARLAAAKGPIERRRARLEHARSEVDRLERELGLAARSSKGEAAPDA